MGRVDSKNDRTIGDSRLQPFDRFGQPFIHNMQVFQPIADVVDIRIAVGNAPQADKRDTEGLAGA
jgi:hypothetical protein